MSEIYNYSTKTTDVTFLTPLFSCRLLQVSHASAPYWFDHVFMIDTKFQSEHLIQTMFICWSARLQQEISDSQISSGACGGNVQTFKVLMAFSWDEPQLDAPNIDPEGLSRRRNQS